MEDKPASRECCPSAVGLRPADCVHPVWMCRRFVPKRRAVRAARGIAGHLQHRGSTSGTREPHVSAEQAKPGKPPSPATSHVRGGASVVVRVRESRAHGEGRQSASTESKPQGKAMYVAPSSDEDWLLSEQRKLYARSYENPDYVFRKLWGLMTDPRNLRLAFGRVARNRGRRAWTASRSGASWPRGSMRSWTR